MAEFIMFETRGDGISPAKDASARDHAGADPIRDGQIIRLIVWDRC
jgi:hypothetical protein